MTTKLLILSTLLAASLAAPLASGSATAIQYPLPASFSTEHQLFRFEAKRLNLRGGTISRFLTMIIEVNCGDDSALVTELTHSGERLVTDTLTTLCEPLSFNDVRTTSGKNDLREQMILALNRAFNTTSIRDVYYNSFIVY